MFPISTFSTRIPFQFNPGSLPDFMVLKRQHVLLSSYGRMVHFRRLRDLILKIGRSYSFLEWRGTTMARPLAGSETAMEVFITWM